MNSNELRERTKRFTVRIIKLASRLPRNRVGDGMGRQSRGPMNIWWTADFGRWM